MQQPKLEHEHSIRDREILDPGREFRSIDISRPLYSRQAGMIACPYDNLFELFLI